MKFQKLLNFRKNSTNCSFTLLRYCFKSSSGKILIFWINHFECTHFYNWKLVSERTLSVDVASSSKNADSYFEKVPGRPIYIDAQATTPMVIKKMNGLHLMSFDMTKCVFFQDPRVLDAMLPFLLSHYGNAHSRTHSYGWESEQAVEKARQVIAKNKFL